MFNNGLYFEVSYNVVVKKFTFAVSSPDEFLSEATVGFMMSPKSE